MCALLGSVPMSASQYYAKLEVCYDQEGREQGDDDGGKENRNREIGRESPRSSQPAQLYNPIMKFEQRENAL